jgi:hypothetical protein
MTTVAMHTLTSNHAQKFRWKELYPVFLLVVFVFAIVSFTISVNRTFNWRHPSLSHDGNA